MCKEVSPTKSNSTGIGVRRWRMTRRVSPAKRPPRKRLRTAKDYSIQEPAKKAAT